MKHRPWQISGTHEIDEPWINLAGAFHPLAESLTITYTGTVYPGYPQTWEEPAHDGDIEVEFLLNGQPCPENTIFVRNRLDNLVGFEDMLIEDILEQEPPDDFDDSREDRYGER